MQGTGARQAAIYLVCSDHDILQDERPEQQQLVVGVGVEHAAGVSLAQGLAYERLEGALHVQLRRHTQRA